MLEILVSYRLGSKATMNINEKFLINWMFDK